MTPNATCISGLITAATKTAATSTKAVIRRGEGAVLVMAAGSGCDCMVSI